MKRLLCSCIFVIILATASAAQAADGQAVYDQNCGVCHNLPRSPIPLLAQIGDKAAWAPKIKQGTDALVASVINGKGAMPARAGKPNLSDDDIRAAVEYIESKSQ